MGLWFSPFLPSNVVFSICRISAAVNVSLSSSSSSNCSIQHRINSSSHSSASICLSNSSISSIHSKSANTLSLLFARSIIFLAANKIFKLLRVRIFASKLQTCVVLKMHAVYENRMLLCVSFAHQSSQQPIKTQYEASPKTNH